MSYVNRELVFYHIEKAMEQLKDIVNRFDNDNKEVPENRNFYSDLIRPITHLNVLSHIFDKTNKELKKISKDKISEFATKAKHF